MNENPSITLRSIPPSTPSLSRSKQELTKVYNVKTQTRQQQARTYWFYLSTSPRKGPCDNRAPFRDTELPSESKSLQSLRATCFDVQLPLRFLEVPERVCNSTARIFEPWSDLMSLPCLSQRQHAWGRQRDPSPRGSIRPRFTTAWVTGGSCQPEKAPPALEWRCGRSSWSPR